MELPILKTQKNLRPPIAPSPALNFVLFSYGFCPFVFIFIADKSIQIFQFNKLEVIILTNYFLHSTTSSIFLRGLSLGNSFG